MRRLVSQFFLVIVVFIPLLTACSSESKDELKPVLTLTGEVAGTVNMNSVRIEGTLQDNVQVAKFSYSLNGGQSQDILRFLEGNTFRFSVENLSAGDNVILITAFDAAGNAVEKEVKVSFQEEAPIPPSPSPDPFPDVSGVWGNQVLSYTHCYRDYETLLVFHFEQLEGGLLTGQVTMGRSWDTQTAEFEGQVNQEGLISGSTSFVFDEKTYEGDVKFQVVGDVLEGTLTFENIHCFIDFQSKPIVLDTTLQKGVDVPTPPTDDALEPNNTLAQASGIILNSSHDLIFVTTTQDWFKFTTTKNEFVTLQLSVLEQRSFSGYLEIYNASEQSLRQVYMSSNNDNKVTLFLEPGAYYFSLSLGVYDSDSMNYRFALTTDMLPDADLEPNDSKATATVISTGFKRALYLTSTDEDWYTLTLNQDQLVTINWSAGSGGNAPGYKLLHDSKVVVERYTNSNDANKPVVVGLPAGSYQIVVSDYDYPGSRYQSPYTLELTTQAMPDTYEPNNSFNTAKTITLPFAESSYMAWEDEDWYKFEVTGEKLVLFKATVPEGSCLYSFYAHLYDANGMSVNTLYFHINPVMTDAHLLTSGTYYLNVQNPDSSYGHCSRPYTLDIYAEDVADADLEPNNSKQQASLIDFGFDREILVEAANEDWFKFTLSQSTQIKVSHKNMARETINVGLLRENNTEIYLNYQLGNDGFVTATPILAAGAYYLRAKTYYSSSTTAKYRLKFEKK